MSVGLLDTSVVIDLGRIDPAELPVELAITAITLGELSVGPLTASTVGERSRRLQVLQAVEHEFAQTIYPYDAAAARAFGEVMAAALQRGRTSQARASDFQIAAIAIANFVDIDRLELHASPLLHRTELPAGGSNPAVGVHGWNSDGVARLPIANFWSGF